MKYWLMKSEEADYSISDLKRDKKVAWFGVRNYQARNFMRDEMSIGDMVLYYHSNAKPSGVAGIAKVCSKPYPDPTQFDITSKYYDFKATQEKPRWILVDISFVKQFKDIFPLSTMRVTRGLQKMATLQPGSRLSITPVTEKEFEIVVVLAQ